jgi:hypothetical protein
LGQWPEPACCSPLRLNRAQYSLNGGPAWIRTKDQGIMRADIQRKPLGFQELTSPKYRCVSFCVTNLT